MERSTITIDEFGNVILPNDTTDVWMNESELLDLFGVTAPTVRSGRDKGSLQKWRIEGVRDKAYHTPIRQVQHGVLQP